jgi:hypothetical protein
MIMTNKTRATRVMSEPNGRPTHSNMPSRDGVAARYRAQSGDPTPLPSAGVGGKIARRFLYSTFSLSPFLIFWGIFSHLERGMLVCHGWGSVFLVLLQH